VHLILDGNPTDALRAARLICALVELSTGVECRPDGVTVRRRIARQEILL